MTQESSTGPGPLALLLEAVGKAIPLLRNSGWITKDRKDTYAAAASELELTAAQVQPIANAEPVARSCRCGVLIEDLPELGASIVRLSNQPAYRADEMYQLAANVAGFCSSDCWERLSPNTFPGITHS